MFWITQTVSPDGGKNFYLDPTRLAIFKLLVLLVSLQNDSKLIKHMQQHMHYIELYITLRRMTYQWIIRHSLSRTFKFVLFSTLLGCATTSSACVKVSTPYNVPQPRNGWM